MFHSFIKNKKGNKLFPYVVKTPFVFLFFSFQLPDFSSKLFAQKLFPILHHFPPHAVKTVLLLPTVMSRVYQLLLSKQCNDSWEKVRDESQLICYFH